MLKSFFAGSILMLLPLWAHADATDQATLDAEFIVEVTISAELYEIAMDSVGALMASSLVGEFSKQGKTMSERSSVVLGDMMAERLAADMTDKMKVEMVTVYTSTLSPQALSGFRAFLETPEGQEFASAQPQILIETTAAGEAVGEAIVTGVVEGIIQDIEAGNFPEDTPIRIQKEIQSLYEE